jgi:hypothetical protein
MDPSGSNNMRYWDGAQWTEHVGAPPPQQPQGQSFDQTVNSTVDSVAKAFQDSKGSQVILLPGSYDAAFAATAEVLPSISMSVRSADPQNGVIVDSTGMSLSSWGEDITIRLQAADDGQGTNLWMESKMKFGLVNWGKHEKNFQAIANAVHARLAGAQNPVPPPAPPQQSPPQAAPGAPTEPPPGPPAT